MINRVVVHIGFPKSGSSTLQHIFSHNDKINFLGIIRDHSTISLRKESKNEFFFRFIRGVKNDYNEAIKIKQNLSKKKINVISDEDFISSHPINYKEKLTRLKKIFPDCKIILVLRNPIDTVISWHNFHIRGGLNSDLLKIENYLKSDRSFYVRDVIKFKERIMFLEQLFGKDNLNIINFDNLFKENNTQNILNEVFKEDINLNKVNIKKNTSYSFLSSIYLKYPFLYKLKFILPKTLIKFVRIILASFILEKYEKKFKKNLNLKKKYYLENKIKNEISDYHEILKIYKIL